MKRVAILQSNYIPWKGYFDMIAAVDEFILYDDMQYTRRDWRNRNRIKTPRGAEWLTIAVDVKGKYHQKIRETRVAEPGWNEVHWKIIEQNYRRAPYFDDYAPQLRETYFGLADESYLSRINYTFIRQICDILGIKTTISWSMDYDLVDGRTERLVGLCLSAGATSYLSGPAARDYIDPSLFDQAGLGLEYMDYGLYQEYPQLWGKFDHFVTVLDLLFNVGADALKYMKTGSVGA